VELTLDERLGGGDESGLGGGEGGLDSSRFSVLSSSSSHCGNREVKDKTINGCLIYL
jgi:hypothetical protein